MPRLVLIRHAKSSWASPQLSDFDRPLNDRGREDAPNMGRRLAQKGFLPSLVLVSTAARAQETAEHLLSAWGVDPAVIVPEAQLYEASFRGLLARVNGLDEKEPCVCLIGHNPGMSYLAGFLSQSPVGDMPTSAVVVLDFTVPWVEVSEHTGVLVGFDYPKKG